MSKIKMMNYKEGLDVIKSPEFKKSEPVIGVPFEDGATVFTAEETEEFYGTREKDGTRKYNAVYVNLFESNKEKDAKAKDAEANIVYVPGNIARSLKVGTAYDLVIKDGWIRDMIEA